MSHEDTEQEEAAQFAGPKQEAPFFQALFCPCDRDYIDEEDDEETEDHKFAHFVEEHQEEPGVLWFSFFSDLIYVCVIVKFTEQYKHFVEEEEIHPETHAGHWFEIRLTLELMLYFLAFFTIWLELVQIKARFYDLPGAWDDVIQFFYLVGVVWMAIQMDASSYLLDNKAGFVIGFAICATAMFVLHLLYFGAIPDCRNYVKRRLMGYGIIIPLLAGCIFVDLFFDWSQSTMEWLTVGTILVCCLILLSIAFVSFRVMAEYNYTAKFFSMRFGILTMIIIGESMLACIIGDKTFGFLKVGGSAAVHAATTVLSSAAHSAAGSVVKGSTTDVTLAPDATITDNNVLQFLKNYDTPEFALGAFEAAKRVGAAAASAAGSVSHAASYATSQAASHAGSHAGSYVLNKHHYYVYDKKGAFFQHGGDSNIEDYIGIFLAFGTLYILKNIYFGSHDDIAEDCLKNAQSPGAVWYIACHVPMYFFLLTGGAGFRLMFTVIHDEKVYEGYVALLVMSVALAITFMLMLRLARPNGGHMGFPELVLRLATVFVLSSLVLIFLDAPIPLMTCVFIITCLSWIYDLVFPPVKEDSHHEDSDTIEASEEIHDAVADCWTGFLNICGLAEACGEGNREYKDNFTGPKEEGHIVDLLEDVICCKLCYGPSAVPEYFDQDYQEEITTAKHHGHGDHGYDSSSKPKETGTGHGMFGEFTDLIYVAIVIKFAEQMKYKQFTAHLADGDFVETDDDRFRIYFEAAIFFLCFFYTWLELTHALLRFKNMPGIFDDMMLFFYLAGVVGMAVNLNHLEFLTERRLGFCSWFSFALASLAVLHIFYMQIDDAEAYVMRRLPALSFGAVASLVAGFLSPEYCLLVLTVAVVVPLIVSVNSYRVWDGQEFDKHHQFHYIERFGLIIMICIGESVLALVLVDFEKKIEFYLMIFIAFLTMYIILQTYIRSDSDVKAHALAEGEICGSITWVCFHGIAAYCLLGMGVGYKMILPYADKDSIGEVQRFTMVYSLFGVMMCFIMIRAAHNLFQLTTISFAVRLFVAGSALVAGHFLENPIYIVSVCLGVAVTSFALDFLFIDTLMWEVDPDLWRKIHGKGEGTKHLLKHRGEGSYSGS